MQDQSNPHWSVERNLADDGWIRLVATSAGTCAIACDTMGNPLTWDAEPLYAPASVAEELFDPCAFEQMPGQLAMGQDIVWWRVNVAVRVRPGHLAGWQVADGGWTERIVEVQARDESGAFSEARRITYEHPETAEIRQLSAVKS